VISKEHRDAALTDLQFNQLIKNTDAYLNNMFIFGGIIAETKITIKGTELEVVQSPLDRTGNIADRDVSEGRFIITTTKYLDPLIYRKGRDITVAGLLTGSKKGLIGEIEYTYPVFEAREIYLFKEEKSFPYPYPYWYDPFYYPPFYYPHAPFWYWP
jgi:outer membrane lipoprotein